jgi:hypothetical protein
VRGRHSPSIFRGAFGLETLAISRVRYVKKAFRVRHDHVTNAISQEAEKHFAWDMIMLQTLEAAVVKTKLSWEKPLKNYKLQFWKWSFPARQPPKTCKLEVKKFEMSFKNCTRKL